MGNIRSLDNKSLIFPYFNTAYSPLSEKALLLRAPLFKDQSAPGGTEYKVISIKDFPEAGYLPVPERTVILQKSADKAREYTVQPYDVLMTMVGTIGRVTVAGEDVEDNWLPATNIFIIRFHTDRPRSARALYGLIKSSAGQTILDDLAHGSGIQLVSKKQFSRVMLPAFNTDLFSRTEALWNEELTLYRESLQKLEACRRIYGEMDDQSVTARAI
jgi:hypothetical protein